MWEGPIVVGVILGGPKGGALGGEGRAGQWLGTLQLLAFGSDHQGLRSQSAPCQLGEHEKLMRFLQNQLPGL